jgi:uncharacterized membrane protein
MSLIEHREGIEAGRLDIFVDGVFAFTLTLLVIGGGEIPDSSEKLVRMLGGIPAFAVCFFQIAYFWHGHVRWRRHCLASDGPGLWLSLMLVFFALIFVYPLHMVFAGAFSALSGGWLPSPFELHSQAELRTLFVCYGLSYACMAGTLTLLFRHASRRALHAGFNGFHEQREALRWIVPAAVGLASTITALLLPLSSPSWLLALPGYMYILLFLISPVVVRFNRRHGLA